MRASHDARLLERLVLFRLVPERGGVLRVMIITTLLPQSFSGGGFYYKGSGLWLLSVVGYCVVVCVVPTKGAS